MADHQTKLTAKAEKALAREAEAEYVRQDRDLLTKLLARIEHDVTLKCYDGDVSASSLVLSMQSDVFHVMFNGNFIESKSKIIAFDEWYVADVRMEHLSTSTLKNTPTVSSYHYYVYLINI